MAGMMERAVERTEVPVGKAESILAAAKRTFLASGFGTVSMDTIAREAGYRRRPSTPISSARKNSSAP